MPQQGNKYELYLQEMQILEEVSFMVPGYYFTTCPQSVIMVWEFGD